MRNSPIDYIVVGVVLLLCGFFLAVGTDANGATAGVICLVIGALMTAFGISQK